MRGRVIVTVVLSCLVAGCAATGEPDGEVEVGGRVLESDGSAELSWDGWRDDGGDRDPAPADDAPADAVSLDDGFEPGGRTWSVGEGEWVEVSSRVLDRRRPSLSADVVLVGADEGGADLDDDAREVTCRLDLQAPVDRGLRAEGELYVELLVTGPEQQPVRIAHGRLPLDLGLAAGEALVAEAGHRHTVERTEGTQVECAVAHEPA